MILYVVPNVVHVDITGSLYITFVRLCNGQGIDIKKKLDSITSE